MKNLLLTILFVFIGLPMFGQEVRFPTSIVSAGGSSDEESSVNMSRWRIGQVHVLTLPEKESFKDKTKETAVHEKDWNVNIYPNPVEDYLYLKFELSESREFLLKITDAAGRVVFIREPQSYINGSITGINMSHFIPALYLLQVISPDLKYYQVYHIQTLTR